MKIFIAKLNGAFKAWASDHPYGNFLAGGYLISVACLSGVWEAWQPALLALYVVGLLAFAISIGCHVNRRRRNGITLTLMLVLGVLLPTQAQPLPAQAQPNAGGVVIGVTVLVVGGVAYVVLNGVCKKLFGEPPKSGTNNSLFGQSPEEDTEAASFAFTSPYSCSMEAGLALSQPAGTGTAVKICISDGEITSIKTSTNVINFTECNRIFESYGIQQAQHPWESFAARNGIPIDPDESTIRFYPASNSISIGDTKARAVTLQRSTNLTAWTTLDGFGGFSFSSSLPVVFIDAGADSEVFYRIL